MIRDRRVCNLDVDRYGSLHSIERGQRRRSFAFRPDDPVLAVFDVASKLPSRGVGQRISRKTWEDNSFWTVERVQVKLVAYYLWHSILVRILCRFSQTMVLLTMQDGRHGKAYGVLTWRGESQQLPPLLH